MDIHALGLMGRGFTTEPSPAFALPLDQTKCSNCGLCVQLCPTGALTEKANLQKQVPLDEQITEATIDIDGRQASVLVSKYNGKILRVIPNDEVSRNAGLIREALLSLIAKSE